mmetsp:Transcript_59484/g.110094  ORF Transcript_59484/g.110094 Transcript_59484/m.110094 type:complete len:295 (-) Transcript_59484:82-966(-)
MVHVGMGPVSGGLVAGVLHVVLGPDHLCTIITLSACQGAQAFWFGVTWALGHVAGLAVVGLAVMLMDVNASTTWVKAFEHAADYVLGIVLILFGAWYWYGAEKYFDANWKPKEASCACHAHLLEEEDLCCHPAGSEEGSGDETQPLLPPPAHHHEGVHIARRLSSMALGFLQGVACPAAALGFLFLRDYGWREGIAFSMVFVVATTFAMGMLAMGYGQLTQKLASKAMTRIIYYCSCGLSILLGGAWLVVAYTYGAEGGVDAFLDGHNHGGDDAGSKTGSHRAFEAFVMFSAAR